MPVMVLNMSRLCVVRIPAAYLLSTVLGKGPNGLWWAIFLSNSLIAVAASIWFSTGSWKRKVIDAESKVGRAGLAVAVGSKE